MLFRSPRPTRRVLVALLSAATLSLSGCGTDLDPSDATAAVAEADAAPPTARTVEPATARELIEGGAVVIDVRTPEEFDAAHVEGARNIDLQDVGFTDEIHRLDRGDTYVVYCSRAACAASAASRMLSAGFEEVVDAGGFDRLEAVGTAVD